MAILSFHADLLVILKSATPLNQQAKAVPTRHIALEIRGLPDYYLVPVWRSS
jgi:hypothetical protein